MYKINIFDLDIKGQGYSDIIFIYALCHILIHTHTKNDNTAEAANNNF